MQKMGVVQLNNTTPFRNSPRIMIKYTEAQETLESRKKRKIIELNIYEIVI
jgi:hypothetical protein